MEVGNQGMGLGWGEVDVFQRATSPSPNNQGARPFINKGRGLHAETAQSALTVILKLVSGALTSILIVLGTVNL